MSFLRVRGKTPGDPAHEFDAPEALVAASPDLYEVLDPEPVPAGRPATYAPTPVSAPAAKRGTRKAAPKRGVTKSATPRGTTKPATRGTTKKEDSDGA